MKVFIVLLQIIGILADNFELPIDDRESNLIDKEFTAPWPPASRFNVTVNGTIPAGTFNLTGKF